jgi:hypothetical protein
MSAESASTSAANSIAMLGRLRDRMLPMLQAVVDEYKTRSDPGYPVLLDNVEFGGYFGIMLDPAYGLYFITDGEEVFAQINMVGWRNDARSSANKERFAGTPFAGVRPVPETLSNQELRNLLSELLAHWNLQPLLLYRTDS